MFTIAKSLARKVVLVLICMGIAWGIFRYLGNDEPFLSPAWFTDALAKMGKVSAEGGAKLTDIIRGLRPR